MIASEMGHALVVDRLIEAGAKLQLRDKHGLTARDLALSNGHSQVANRF